jgi:hypothetical protein
MFAGQDRDSLRAVFFRAWARQQRGEPLEGVETLIVQVASRHPEYHALLASEAGATAPSLARAPRLNPVGEGATAPSLARAPRLNPVGDAAGRDYLPETGETNPFLHMAMHIAIEESLVLDQPRGIREHYRKLLARTADEHAVQHQMMDCLGEMLWRANRDRRAPDPAGYLECLARLTAR